MIPNKPEKMGVYASATNAMYLCIVVVFLCQFLPCRVWMFCDDAVETIPDFKRHADVSCALKFLAIDRRRNEAIVRTIVG